MILLPILSSPLVAVGLCHVLRLSDKFSENSSSRKFDILGASYLTSFPHQKNKSKGQQLQSVQNLRQFFPHFQLGCQGDAKFNKEALSYVGGKLRIMHSELYILKVTFTFLNARKWVIGLPSSIVNHRTKQDCRKCCRSLVELFC